MRSGRIAKLQHALRDVVLHQRRTHDLRQIAIGVAAKGIHLPKPVLRCYIALGNEEVFLRRRFNVRHAVSIAADGDRR